MKDIKVTIESNGADIPGDLASEISLVCFKFGVHLHLVGKNPVISVLRHEPSPDEKVAKFINVGARGG